MARRAKARQASGVWRRRRRQFIAGGVLLVLVLGIGALIRWWQQHEVLARLQSTRSTHYTRGPAKAPVVIKEFSDYT